MTEHEIITKQPIGGYQSTDTHDEKIVKLPPTVKEILNAKKITVVQHVDPVEVIPCCFARPSRYSLYVNDGEEQVLYGQENCYARQIMGAARSLSLKFSDLSLIDVLRVDRPQTCSRGCCGLCCSLPVLNVNSPPDTHIATVYERRTCCRPHYEIVDPAGTSLFSFNPRCCYPGIIALCCDITFEVLDNRGEVAATLTKHSRGNCRECIGHSNTFSITYKDTLSLNDKLSILGATFLFDYHYFEKQNRFCC